MSGEWRMVTRGDFDDYAVLSGDSNPIHIDPAYAATTPFEVPVAHGMFLFSLLVGQIQERWPGALVESLDIMFPAPTPQGERVRFEIDADGAPSDPSDPHAAPRSLRVAVVHSGGTQGLRGTVTIARAGQKAAAGAPAAVARGERYEEQRTFTPGHAAALAELTGEGGGGSVPAGLILGAISKILGMDLPGEGTNYLKQRLTFLAVAQAGAELALSARVERVLPEKRLVYLTTRCTDGRGTLIAEGTALVLARGRLPAAAEPAEDIEERERA